MLLGSDGGRCCSIVMACDRVVRGAAEILFIYLFILDAAPNFLSLVRKHKKFKKKPF